MCRSWVSFSPKGHCHITGRLAAWPFFYTCLFCAQEVGPFRSLGTTSHQEVACILALLLNLSVLCAGGWPFSVPGDHVTLRGSRHPGLLYLSVLCAGGWPFSVPRNNVTPRGSWHPGPSFVSTCLLCVQVGPFWSLGTTSHHGLLASRPFFCTCLFCVQDGGPFSVPRDHVTTWCGWHPGPSCVPVFLERRRWALFGPWGPSHTMMRLASRPIFCTCLFCVQEVGPFRSLGTTSHPGSAGILALLLTLLLLA
jgi:hypothetical protein